MIVINTVSLIGRWARENELRFSPSGVAILKNAIAVNRPFSKTKEVDFIDVTVLGKVAENANNFTGKGSLIGLVGRIQQEKWETQDGEKRQRIVVLATEVEFLEFKNKDNQQSSNNGNGGDFGQEIPADFQVVDDDEDIPF